MRRCCRNCGHFIPDGIKNGVNCLEGGPTEISDPDRVMTEEDCSKWVPGSEEIYELTAEILVLGWNAEEAKERARRTVFINEVLEGPVPADWSHLDDSPEYKKLTIKRITRSIQRRERKH